MEFFVNFYQEKNEFEKVLKNEAVLQIAEQDHKKSLLKYIDKINNEHLHKNH